MVYPYWGRGKKCEQCSWLFWATFSSAQFQFDLYSSDFVWVQGKLNQLASCRHIHWPSNVSEKWLLNTAKIINAQLFMLTLSPFLSFPPPNWQTQLPLSVMILHLGPQTALEVAIKNWTPVRDNYMITLLTKFRAECMMYSSLITGKADSSVQ